MQTEVHEEFQRRHSRGTATNTKWKSPTPSGSHLQVSVFCLTQEGLFDEILNGEWSKLPVALEMATSGHKSSFLSATRLTGARLWSAAVINGAIGCWQECHRQAPMQWPFTATLSHHLSQVSDASFCWSMQAQCPHQASLMEESPPVLSRFGKEAKGNCWLGVVLQH